MNFDLRRTITIASLAIAGCAVSAAAIAQQPDSRPQEQGMGRGAGMMGGEGMGTGGQGMGAMMGTMQGCREMMQRAQAPGLPHLPPGNEKLELQMHADMMKATSEILSKYAARLPDRK